VTSPALQTIQNGLGAWSRGDLEGALENLGPDIEFVSSGLFPGVEPVYRGHEGFRRFWSDFRETWEEIKFEIEHLVPGEPPRFAVLGHFEATGRDGIGVGRPIGMVFSVPDEMATRIESHPTWDAACDAAGVAAEDRP